MWVFLFFHTLHFYWCVFVINAELPKHAPYLVIGAGTAAFAAYRAIRAADAKAKVCIYNMVYVTDR